uniref:Uncharacterized protein n=1 Tax=Solenopsis invicta TaxID=13686 RepID=D3KD04_SOLIN|nr:hypothetical protein [Solenopsis invicta]
MRLTLVFLIVTIVMCAMFQESEQFWGWGGRRYRGWRGGCRRRTTTSPTTTSSTTTGASSTVQTRRRREIEDTPLVLPSAIEV